MQTRDVPPHTWYLLQPIARRKACKQEMHSSYLVLYYNPLSGALQINKRCTSTYLVFITTHCQAQSMQTREAPPHTWYYITLQPIARRTANKLEMHSSYLACQKPLSWQVGGCCLTFVKICLCLSTHPPKQHPPTCQLSHLALRH